jgi:acetyltransferase-like isoleucine patch superfamily enzyme
MPSDFVAGDTAAKIGVQCYNKDGSVFNLTGHTIKLRFRIGNGALVNAAMTVLTPATLGQAEYKFTTGQLVAGRMKCRAQVTLGDGTILSSQDVGTFNVAADV